jgi:hypothetical protein
MTDECGPKEPMTPEPRIPRYVPPCVSLGKEGQDKKSRVP